MQISVRIDYRADTWGGAIADTQLTFKDPSDILASRIKQESEVLPAESMLARMCAPLLRVYRRFFYSRPASAPSLLFEALSVCMKRGDEVTVLQHAQARPYMRPLRQDEIWELRRQIKAAHRLIFTIKEEWESWIWTVYPKKT